jgi:hypothetical protein
MNGLVNKGVDAKVLMKHILHIFIQLFNAIEMAQKAYKYMHWDLHSNNVIIKKVDYPVSFDITLQNGTVIKMNDVEYVPMIIDYGMNCLTINGAFLGNFFDNSSQNLSKVNVNKDMIFYLGLSEHDYYCPLFDVFRFLIYTFVQCISSTRYHPYQDWFKLLYIGCWELFNRQAASQMTSSVEAVKATQDLLGAGMLEQFVTAYEEGLKIMSPEFPVIASASFFRGKDAGDWLVSMYKHLPQAVKKLI